nr:transposase [Enterococcus faecium]
MASTHDIHMAIEVVDQSPTPQVLADKGYVSQTLKDSFEKKRIHFWTPRKRNLEVILLTYRFLLEEAQKIVPGTLKYSLGYF